MESRWLETRIQFSVLSSRLSVFSLWKAALESGLFYWGKVGFTTRSRSSRRAFSLVWSSGAEHQCASNAEVQRNAPARPILSAPRLIERAAPLRLRLLFRDLVEGRCANRSRGLWHRNIASALWALRDRKWNRFAVLDASRARALQSAQGTGHPRLERVKGWATRQQSAVCVSC